MSDLLRDIEQVDYIVRQLQKIESKMQVGHFIPAYRELCRMVGYFLKVKQDILRENVDGKNNVK